MYDFLKRFMIAFILMIFIGMMIIGGKVFHAEEAPVKKIEGRMVSCPLVVSTGLYNASGTRR
ncbi:MAG TPA: hypothetical protein VFK33_04850 [Bacillales bacterium]|nr:hypothetical protein [Bacillales bacterium]